MNKADVLILGAGASGLAAACVSCGRVIVLEKEARVGRKLMATGNGRCNLLNLSGFAGRYHGSGASLAEALLCQISPEDLLAFFESLGLVCTADSAGRVYPLCGQAGAVVDVLRFACARRGVSLLCDTRVSDLAPVPGGFEIAAGNERFFAPKVIVSTGGAAAPSLGADTQVLSMLERLGHRMVSMRPALSPLRLPVEKIRGLKGVRVFCRLSLLSGGKTIREEDGEALFTDYGVSGIAAMQLARQADELLTRHKPALLSIRLLEHENPQALCEDRSELFAHGPLEDFFTGLLHKRIGLALLREAKLSPADPVSASAARRLAPLLKDWRIPISGVQPFAHAQVTSGGLLADDFHADTLESRLLPGLYGCGEALDVDADCGGYNLMWSWASGLTAGKACARSLT